MSQSRWDISLEVFKKSVIQSGIDVTVPTGMALWSMLSTAYGIDTNIMYRGDQTHLSYGFGRYIAACTNFVALITPVFGVSILGNTYRCADIGSGKYTLTEQQALDCQLFALSANGNRFEFIDTKHAKSALAMAQISQLLPYFGGPITDEEWYNESSKYTIEKCMNRMIKDSTVSCYYLLSFHTAEQRDNFLKYNERIVKDYLMID